MTPATMDTLLPRLSLLAHSSADDDYKTNTHKDCLTPTLVAVVMLRGLLVRRTVARHRR